MGPFMDIISSGCVTVRLGGKDRGSGPSGRLELVRKGLGCSRASSPKTVGPSERIEWLLITESRCHAFGNRVLASPCVGSGAVVERGVTSISPGVRSSSCPDPF